MSRDISSTRQGALAFDPPLAEAPQAHAPQTRLGRGQLRALADMALAMLLVGATAPLGEIALAGIPLFPALAVRLALAGLALSAFGLREGQTQKLLPRHWAVLTLQALCGVVVFNAGLWLGMRESSPAAAGVFTSATPAVMAALGMLFFGERPSARTVAGIGLTMAGVAAARGVTKLAWNPGAGDLLLLAAVCGEAVFLLALRWLPKWLSPLGAARRVTWIGLAMTVPLALVQWAWGTDAGPGSAGTAIMGGIGAWLAVAALGVLVTAGGYVLWFRGVGSVRAGQAAAITGLMPVSAVLSSWLLLGAAPTPGQALGCAAVGAGIWLAARKG
jgi:drug/metabolite transporter (DMT)-like permease